MSARAFQPRVRPLRAPLGASYRRSDPAISPASRLLPTPSVRFRDVPVGCVRHSSRRTGVQTPSVRFRDVPAGCARRSARRTGVQTPSVRFSQ